MIRKILSFLFAFCTVTLFSQELEQHGSCASPEIFIIGTIHSMHFEKDYHYSILDLQAQIMALEPDLVCGEITPEAFGQAMEGYFPPEAAFLAQMASRLGYRFVPADWRLDYATQAKADSIYPDSVEKQVVLFGKRYLACLNGSDNPSVYDDIHDESNIELVDSVFEKIIGVDPVAECAHGNWHERNRHIAENGLAASVNTHRIVFVFGSDHIPQIRRQLKALGIEAQIPERMFVPDNNYEVPDEVLDRWKRNLENLRLIRDRKIQATEDDYQKVINSRRIQDLELAIQRSSN